MSRDVQHLHPLLQPLCRRHLDLASREITTARCILSFTYRSIKEQDELYLRGRDVNGRITNPKLIVTYARGGASWHNTERRGVPSSLAYDLLLVDISQKPLRSEKVEWQILGHIGLDLGLDWGVDGPRGKYDLGHFYLRGANRITLADAKSGIEPLLA